MPGVIYALSCVCDPTALRYVGQSRYAATTRLSGHRKAASKGSALPVHKWMRKHSGVIGCEITTTPMEYCGLDFLNERERYWRVHLLELGHDLLNCSADDYTPMGEETRAKLSTNATMRYSDPKERQRAREIQLAAWQDEELLAKHSADAKHRYETDPEIHEKLSVSARRSYINDPERAGQQSVRLSAMWDDADTRLKLAKSTHNRWHVNRNIVKPGCLYCEAVA